MGSGPAVSGVRSDRQPCFACHGIGDFAPCADEPLERPTLICAECGGSGYEPSDGSDVTSDCAACGEPVSYTDEGGCVGTLPNAYHFRASCLLEALRRESAEAERLRERIDAARDKLDNVMLDQPTRIRLAREALTSDITALPSESDPS